MAGNVSRAVTPTRSLYSGARLVIHAVEIAAELKIRANAGLLREGVEHDRNRLNRCYLLVPGH